jgi:phage gp46-like protein
MVNKSSIIALAKQYKHLYTCVLMESTSAGDKERANYGLKQANALLNIIELKNEVLTNVQLKQIHNLFTNITRGVEYFEDNETEQKDRELGSKLYALKQEIDSHIKW